jgi:hypothetical protein
MDSIEDQKMKYNIGEIARHLNRLANVAEARWARDRQTGYHAWVEEEGLAGICSHEGCLQPVIAMINQVRYCRVHMDEAFERFGEATAAVKAGFADIEQAVREGR